MDSSDEEKLPPKKEIGGSKQEKSEKSLHDALKKLRIDKDSDDDSDLSDSEYVCSVCNKKFSGFIPFRQHEKGSKHAKALLKKKKEKKLLEKITVAEKEIENDEENLFLIKKPYAVCKPCGKQFGGPESFALHMDSKAHKLKALQSSILDKVRESGKVNVDMLKELYKNKITADDATEDLTEDTQKIISSLKEKDSDEDIAVGGEEFECKDCKKIFTGLTPFIQHLVSKVHAKTVEKKNLLHKIAPEDAQYSAKSELRDLSHLVVEDDILVCKLCSVSFSGPENAMQHLKSRNHSKNLEKYLRKLEKKKKASAEANNSGEKSSEDESSQDTEEPLKSEDESSQDTEEPLKSVASAKSKNCPPKHDSANAEDCPLESRSSDEDRKQESTTAPKHRDDSPISGSSGRKFYASSSESDSSSDDDDKQKATATKNKDDSLAVDKGALSSEMKDKIERKIAKIESVASEKNETLESYKNYKIYKKLLNSLMKDDTDT